MNAERGTNEYRHILESVVGMVFLGTPFQGSDQFARQGASFRCFVAKTMAESVNPTLVDALNPLDPNGELNTLVDDFTKLVYKHRPAFQICCFYETKPTNIDKAVLPILGRAWRLLKAVGGFEQSVLVGPNEFHLSQAVNFAACTQRVCST